MLAELVLFCSDDNLGRPLHGSALHGLPPHSGFLRTCCSAYARRYRMVKKSHDIVIGKRNMGRGQH
eukprot:4012252-Alexandrium_andersonii.AAC.1